MESRFRSCIRWKVRYERKRYILKEGKSMNVLNILASGDIGGIEILCKDIARLSKHSNYFCFVWRGGTVEKEMKNSGFKTVVLGVTSSISYKPIGQIVNICMENRIDVIIVHHPSPLLWAFIPLLKRRMKQIKIVLYAHNNANNMIHTNDWKTRTMRKCLLKQAYNSSDNVFAISHSVKKSLIGLLNVHDEKVNVIYNGIDLQRFNVERDIKNSTVQIIYVGRIIKEKGVQVLVEAISRLPSNLPSYHLNIIGDGPYLENIKKMISEKKQEERISVLGAMRQIPEIMAKSDIFVHPAIWEEGFGIAIVEAMASGLICIATNRGAIPELIDDQINGYLVESNSATAMAEKLAEIITNIYTDGSDCVRYQARKKAEKYSIENMVNRFDNLLEQGIDKG